MSKEPHITGSDYQEERDGERLKQQYKIIFDYMAKGGWHTLGEISSVLNFPAASVSAQLRHFRKSRNGSHTVEKEYIGNGLYKYQLIVNKENECS